MVLLGTLMAPDVQVKLAQEFFQAGAPWQKLGRQILARKPSITSALLAQLGPGKIHFSHPAAELIIPSPAQTPRGHCWAGEEQQQQQKKPQPVLRCQERISVPR